MGRASFYFHTNILNDQIYNRNQKLQQAPEKFGAAQSSLTDEKFKYNSTEHQKT